MQQVYRKIEIFTELIVFAQSPDFRLGSRVAWESPVNDTKLVETVTIWDHRSYSSSPTTSIPLQSSRRVLHRYLAFLPRHSSHSSEAGHSLAAGLHHLNSHLPRPV